MLDPMYRFCNKHVGPRAARRRVPSVLSETLSPESLLSVAPALSDMSAQMLAEHCSREISNYFRGEPSDEQFALELFHRATVRCDQEARLCLQPCFSEILLGWIHRHPRREE